jgi:hypothetical protein
MVMITKEELFPLPDLGVEPHIIKNFFPEEMFESIKKQIKETGMGTETGVYHPMMGRWASGIAPSKEVEEYVLEKVRKIFNDSTIVPAYHYAVMYQRKDGCIPNLWEHMDQNGSQISINIAIENTANWPLIVEGKEYHQEPNDAVIFCGQQHAHARPAFPSKDETVVTTQLFMHYSLPNHWIQKDKSGLHKYGLDGDIRFFNKHRYFPLPDPPVNQPIGSDQDYSPILNYYDLVVGHAYETETELAQIKIQSKEELAPGIMLYKTGKESARIIKGLIQNAMFKQWVPAEIVVEKNTTGVNHNARNCFNYFLTNKQNDCHPQDPIVRAKKSLELGIDSIVEDYRERYSVKPLKSTSTVLLRYEEDNMFHNHYDAAPNYPRVVSVSMFLNDDFEGGELEFKEFNLKIKPEAGNIVVFCSAFPYMHQVCPVITGIRYAAVKWYEFI